jgi:trehalose 6-phosphate phosphatase
MSELSKASPIGDADAVFLDFDGTLAGLQSDRTTVRMTPACEAAVRRVAARLDGALAIISGRDIRDLAARTPADVWRLGAHGLEVCPPGEAPAADQPSAPSSLRDALARLAGEHAGAFLEDKGLVLAVHYRAAPEAGPALEAGVAGEVAAVDGYTWQSGKLVVEAKPVTANKGRALLALAAEPPFKGRRLVMVGDDATDEDAFAAVLSAGGLAIKVGDGATCAPERLADPLEVQRWLEQAAPS